MYRYLLACITLFFTFPILVGISDFKFDPTAETQPQAETGTEGKSKEGPGEPSLDALPPSGEVSSENYGQVIFFPEVKERPNEGRFKVKVGQAIPLCLRFTPGGSKFLEILKKRATGFRLVLEDNKTPPGVILISVGDEFEIIKEDKDGCYKTEFRIPVQVAGGVYQVADLLIRTNRGNHLSIRDYLYNFSKADELDIENTEEDLIGPQLVQIHSYEPAKREMGKHSRTLRIGVKQSFEFKDDGSGIDKKSLRVFYRLSEDGFTISYYEAKCHPAMGEKNKFYCKMQLSKPIPLWYLRVVGLDLDSIYLRDKANNLLFVNDPKVFEKNAKGTPINFTFEGIRRGSFPRSGQEQKQNKEEKTTPDQPKPTEDGPQTPEASSGNTG